MTLAYIILTILWLSLIAYAVLGGADFGSGIWDFLASGPLAQRQRLLIEQALGPVWEANHVWLIFLIVGLFSAFPSVFATVSVALFLPFTLALIGIVLRGAAFVFHAHAGGTAMLSKLWGRVFSTASTITPFLLGTAAAAVASGHIRAQGGQVQTDFWMGWTTPFALTIGAMALSLCAVIAAIYLTIEAQNINDRELSEAFRRRAMFAGIITAALNILGFVLSPSEAPLLWNGLLAHALPAVIATILLGLTTAAALLLRRYRVARILIILVTALMIASWGLSQFPYLIPPDVTIANAASPPATLLALLISIGIGMALLLPSLWFLFHVFRGKNPGLLVEGKGSEKNL